MMPSKYIFPQIRIFHDFESCNKSKNSFYLTHEEVKLEDCLSKNAFVLGEPGSGKSRLLKELLILVKARTNKVAFIDLKKYPCDLPLDEYLEKLKTQKNNISSIEEDFLAENKNFISTDFSCKSEAYVFLDALDEVSEHKFSDMVDRINDFRQSNKSLTIIISCRSHHFEKWKSLLDNFNFNFIRLYNFGRREVIKYMEARKLPEEQIDSILRQFIPQSQWWYYDKTILFIPRYLEVLCNISIVSKDTIPGSRIKLFDAFISEKLKKEKNTDSIINPELVKHVLQKLALVMEINGVNIISKQDLMVFLDDIKSNLTISFLNQIPIQLFYDRGLLKDNIDHVEFENTEFQEYLAAKEIFALGKTEYIVHDLMVVKELREINPSWLNVLGYLLELDNSLFEPVFLFYERQKEGKFPVKEIYNYLANINPESIDVQIRTRFLLHVFHVHCNLGIFIDHTLLLKLTTFFDCSINQELESSIDIYSDGGKANIVEFVGNLHKKNILTEEKIAFWRKKILTFTKTQHSVLQRNICNTIANIGKVKDFKTNELHNLLYSNDILVAESFVRSCLFVGPEDDFTWKSVGEYLRIHPERAPILSDCFFALNTTKAIIKFLEVMNSIPELLNIFSEMTIFSRKEKDGWDGEYSTDAENIVLDILTKYVQNTRFYDRDNLFLIFLCKWCQRNNNSFINKFADIIISSEYAMRFSLFHSMLGDLLSVENVYDVSQKFRKIPNGENYILKAFLYASKQKTAPKDFIDLCESIFPEMIDNDDSKNNQLQKYLAEKDDGIFDTFKFKLNCNSEGSFHSDVFSFYLVNNKVIKPKLTSKIITNFKKLAFSTLNKPVSKARLTQKKNDKNTTFSAPNYIWYYGSAILVAVEFNWDISQFYKQIWAYIPFSDNVTFETILKLIPIPTPKDIDEMVGVYNGSREDSLAAFYPVNFVELCGKYPKYKDKYKDILKRIIELNDFDDEYVKRKALDTYIELEFKDSKEYLKCLLDGEFNDRAKHWLIIKYQDESAINERIKQIVDRAFECEYHADGKVHRADARESELSSKSFASCLMELKSDLFIPTFLNLLDSSMEIFKKSSKYHRYTFYIWDIIKAYFDNLKCYRKYSYLDELEKHLKQYIGDGGEWFDLAELKRSYIDYIEQDDDFRVGINIYNTLKEKQYLKISSSRNLVDLMLDIINKDLKNWIEEEGAYRFIGKSANMQEDLIQKTLLAKFESALLKRGIYFANILRETQLLDDKRTDYLITYGFLPPIIVELKRVDNPEIHITEKREEYRNKFLQYISGNKAEYGIFLVFQINDKIKLEDYISKLEETYCNDENIFITGLDCTMSSC